MKEIRATFSAAPGLEHKRPESRTSIRGLYLAGDWTRSGWPSTMEGAVRSGHLAADAVVNEPGRFLRPDIA
ncbi:MAG: FAD-dependent oxidoreductase [Bryobacter sp.]|nr:FAD-dependent oxidoreductase [Bryobacter sp.]